VFEEAHGALLVLEALAGSCEGLASEAKVCQDCPGVNFDDGAAMPFLITDDGVKLYYEETGSGTPIVFVHEFAGDFRSWEPQVRHFARRHRCVVYNARGWPPSEVPDDVARYSQARARDDVRCVLDHLAIDKAHIVGLSMGGFATLHFGLTYPDRALSLVVAGAGYGAERDQRERFREEAVVIAAKLEREGMAAFAEAYAYGPTRVQFENKDPRGFAEFKAMLAEHSAKGAANTQLGIQRERPSLYDLEDGLKKLTVPTLVLNGDEDWPCLAPGVFLKRAIPSAALQIIPNAGHTINIEEPDAFNAALRDFIVQVESGRWPMRDPRAVSVSITGMKK
jgi:pimeloyl-ACP methyl ester carboxylesterase